MKPIAHIKRKISVAVLVLVGILALVGGGYYAWLITPPPMPTTVQEAGLVLVSPRYLRLPETRRFDYMQRAAELFDKASPKEKSSMIRDARKDPQARLALRQAVEDRIIMEVRQYVKADDFDRRAIIDRSIAMQEMMAATQAKRPPVKDSPQRQAKRDHRQNEFLSRMQDRLEHGNPQNQAYFGEFIDAMMTRRKQMGLNPLPFDPNR